MVDVQGALNQHHVLSFLKLVSLNEANIIPGMKKKKLSQHIGPYFPIYPRQSQYIVPFGQGRDGQ